MKSVVVEWNDGKSSTYDNITDIYLYKDKNEIDWLSLTIQGLETRKINIPVERIRKYETIVRK